MPQGRRARRLRLGLDFTGFIEDFEELGVEVLCPIALHVEPSSSSRCAARVSQKVDPEA